MSRFYKIALVLFFMINHGNYLCDETTNLQQISAPTKSNNNYNAIDYINKFFLNFNTMMNYAFIDPLTSVYDKVLPNGIKNRISDFLTNLMTPFHSLCALLAGDVKESVKSLGAFVGNTLCGAGFFNVTHYNPRYHNLDEVFAKYGMKQGAYLVLPILGPSSVRDVMAKVIGCFANPFYICTNNIANRDRIWIYHAAVTLIDTNKSVYKGVNVLKNSSSDYYAALKSVYMQKTSQGEEKDELDYSDEF